MVLEIPESGMGKVRSGTHKPFLILGATVPEDGGRLQNLQLIADRLSARGIDFDSTDLNYAMIGGSRTNECIIKVSARLAPDDDGDLKAVAGDVASSRKVSYQMDDIGGCTHSSRPTGRRRSTSRCCHSLQGTSAAHLELQD